MRLKLFKYFSQEHCYIELKDMESGKTILQYNNEEISQAIRDGFIDARDWFGSLSTHALRLGLISEDDIFRSDPSDASFP